jgi:hypothetical protein
MMLWVAPLLGATLAGFAYRWFESESVGITSRSAASSS